MTTELIIAKSAIDNLNLKDALEIKNYLQEKMPEFKEAHEKNCQFKIGEKVLYPSGLRGWVHTGEIAKINLASALVQNKEGHKTRVRFEYIHKIPETNSCGF